MKNILNIFLIILLFILSSCKEMTFKDKYNNLMSTLTDLNQEQKFDESKVMIKKFTDEFKIIKSDMIIYKLDSLKNDYLPKYQTLIDNFSSSRVGAMELSDIIERAKDIYLNGSAAEQEIFDEENSDKLYKIKFIVKEIKQPEPSSYKFLNYYDIGREGKFYLESEYDYNQTISFHSSDKECEKLVKNQELIIAAKLKFCTHFHETSYPDYIFIEYAKIVKF